MGKNIVIKSAILSIILFLIDQISKILVTRLLDIHSSFSVINNFFYLTYTHNTGAAFSILTGKRLLLIIISIIVILTIFYYIRKNKVVDKLEITSFSLIIGGSLGNLFDRLLRGYVIDFLDFRFFGYNFPIFNLADVFIVVGVFLIIIKTSRKEDKNANSNRWWHK